MNYQDTFNELKNYLDLKIDNSKKEMTSYLNKLNKNNTYFYENITKTIQTKQESQQLLLNTKLEELNTLIAETNDLKFSLNQALLDVNNTKELLTSEIITNLKSDAVFIDELSTKTIEKLEI